MSGIEVEAAMFSHNMNRHTIDPKIKEMLALVRRVEQQQQNAVNWLIPGDESTLEVTIGYEQVAVDLTSWVAQNEPDPYLKQVYEFGLLEEIDHLYRYANLLLMLEDKKAEKIVGGLTEITPLRGLRRGKFPEAGNFFRPAPDWSDSSIQFECLLSGQGGFPALEQGNLCAPNSEVQWKSREVPGPKQGIKAAHHRAFFAYGRNNAM